MKLYYAVGACSQAVHIALREAALPFTMERVDLRTRKTETGQDWATLNPKGYVPLLELAGGERLTEVANLLGFVADQKPECGLAPTFGTMERYHLNEWLAFVSSELHKTMGGLFDPTAPDATKAALKQKAAKRFAYVGEHLGAGPFLMGERFTVADAYLFVMLRWAKNMAIEVPPTLEGYRDRVASRPAVREALAAEGLS